MNLVPGIYIHLYIYIYTYIYILYIHILYTIQSPVVPIKLWVSNTYENSTTNFYRELEDLLVGILQQLLVDGCLRMFLACGMWPLNCPTSAAPHCTEAWDMDWT